MSETQVTITLPTGITVQQALDAVEALIFESQAHAEVCEDEEHLEELNAALALGDTIIVELAKQR